MESQTYEVTLIHCFICSFNIVLDFYYVLGILLGTGASWVEYGWFGTKMFIAERRRTIVQGA